MPADDFYPDRMVPIHDDAHCPQPLRLLIEHGPEHLDGFIAGAWDGWLGFEPTTRVHPDDPWWGGYVAGQTWGKQFAAAGSPW